MDDDGEIISELSSFNKQDGTFSGIDKGSCFSSIFTDSSFPC